jgi:succinyl-diaminopimelate desuccinylase
MKSEVASFISASEQFLLSSPNFKGSIIIILTGDEEINSKRGAKPLTKILKENNQKIDLCIIGEPTSYKILGDIAKTGRRGSINFEISSKEKFDQGSGN